MERKIPDAAICDAVVSVHRDLLENEDPRIRAIFVSVVERYTCAFSIFFCFFVCVCDVV